MICTTVDYVMFLLVNVSVRLLYIRITMAKCFLALGNRNSTVVTAKFPLHGTVEIYAEKRNI